jgi:hypothetical protein
VDSAHQVHGLFDVHCGHNLRQVLGPGDSADILFPCVLLRPRV